MGRRIVTFELRRRDADLAAALEAMTEDRSDVIRAALRAYLLSPGVLICQEPPKRHTGEVRAAGDDLKGVVLARREPTDDEVVDALDDLLGSF